MIRFADSIIPEHERRKLRISCDHCGKDDRSESFQESLKKCARCFQVFYCGKDCQKADWKVHKKVCTPVSQEVYETRKSLDSTFRIFCKRNYCHIMVQMLRACEQSGLSKNELLVELDFVPNANGIVPAMQENPEFRIVPVKDYLEGSRPAVPNFVTEMHDKQKLSQMKAMHDSLQPNQFFYMIRYSRVCSSLAFCGIDKTTKKELYSQEALLAFKAYMNNGDDGPLSEIMDPSLLKDVKALGAHSGYW